MRVPDIRLSEVPYKKKVRKDTEVKQWFAQNRRDLLAGATDWVHRVSKDALAQALAAGNPDQYFVTIDGVTNAAGTVRRGFKSGTIDESKHAVRIEFNADTIGNIARGVPPILTQVIRETFPMSPTGRLAREWSWWVSREGGPSKRAGKTIPDGLGIYDVLYLAPDYAVAKYAWFANSAAKSSKSTKYNFARKRINKEKGTSRLVARKRARGFLARATQLMRAKRVPGVLFQGGFSRDYLSGRASKHPRGVPFVRVAFKGTLKNPVWV